MKYNDEIPVTLVEFDDFTRFAAKHLSNDECDALKDFLALKPEAGAVIPGAGGVRKLRWALQGRGKRGGARIIYYYHNRDMPLLLLTGFAKNEMDDLTAADRNAMKRAIPFFIDQYMRQS